MHMYWYVCVEAHETAMQTYVCKMKKKKKTKNSRALNYDI